MGAESSSELAATSPTRARHWVLVFAATLSIITFVDRVCISQAQVPIATDLGLTKSQMGWVFSAFIWAYAIFEIPGGWLGDKIGPRKVLMRIVLMWSFFTAATGWAWSWASLLVARFLFGAGEAGCFPNLAKMFTNWLPRVERNRAVGIMWLCTRWGGAFTPLLIVWLISVLGWRRTFELLGVIGIVWAILFFWWFRNTPREHKGVNEAELALLQDTYANSAGHTNVPWSRILHSRSVWLLWLQYFCFGYGWYFYITWLPTYLKEVRHLELQKGALLAGVPLFFGGIGCMLSAWLANWLARRDFRLAHTRRWMSLFGFMGAAAMLFLSPTIADPVWAMMVMGLASFIGDFALTNCWNACLDVGGKYAGSVSGGMNMSAQVGGALAPIVAPYIVEHFDPTWRLTFWISAAVYVVGGFCWFWIDPVTPIDANEPVDKEGGFEVIQASRA